MSARARASAVVHTATALAATALVLSAAPVQAAPGDLDPAFGSAGRLLLPVGPGNANVNAAVAQPDGKLVLAGFAEQQPFDDRDFLVARLNPNGTLDSTFNPGGATPGIVTTPIGAGTADDVANAVALGPGGTIYAVGTTDPPTELSDLAIVRYTGAGLPDTTFSNDAVQVHSTGSSEGAFAAAVQPDGKLVIAGGHGSSEGGMLVARLDGTTGGLDPAFNGTGIREIVFSPGFGIDRASALALQPDGKLVVAGTANLNSADDDIAVARVNDNGTLDTAGFGAGTGMVRTGPAKDQGLALALGVDSKLYVAGSTSPAPGVLDFATLRLLPGGSLDQSFSGDGYETTPFPAPDGTRLAAATSVAAQPDGGAIVGGTAFGGAGPGSADFGALRFGPDGKLYLFFGDSGRRRYTVGQANDFATSGVQTGGGVNLFGFSFDGSREVLSGIRIAADGSVAGPPPAGPGIDHYRVELKAWIPHQVVVDPVRPGQIPFVVGFLGNDCFDPGLASADFRTAVESLLNGNGHVPYDGSFKALAVADFDWDGSMISNFVASGQFGMTQRFLEYTVENPIRRSARLVRCVANTGQSTRTATAERVGANTVVSRISTAIPVIPLAPPIDDRLTSVVSGTPPESRLDLAYTSDLFPTHAYRVYKNGILQITEHISDASCLSAGEVRGLTGAALLGWGLSHEDNAGTASVAPRDAGRFSSRPSLLCNPAYLISRAVEETAKARGLLARAARAPRVTVAPLDRSGRPERFVTLARAEAAGLVDQRREGEAIAIFANPANPVALRLRGRRPALVVRHVQGGSARAARVYRGRRDLLVTQAASIRATSRGRRVRAQPADRTPPISTATVRRRGRQALLRFRVRDRSAIERLDVLLDGRRVTVRRGRARVPLRRLARVRFRSVDVFGNAERLKAPRRR